MAQKYVNERPGGFSKLTAKTKIIERERKAALSNSAIVRSYFPGTLRGHSTSRRQ